MSFMYLSVFLSILVLASGNNSVHPLFNLLGWIYSISFVLAILFMKKQFSLKYSIVFFLIFQIILFSYKEFSGFFDSIIIGDRGGDATSYHFPLALELDTMSKRLQYVFSSDILNGRFTHILLSFYIEILNFFRPDSDVTGGNISRIAHIFNGLISVITIRVVYKSAFLYSENILFSQRAAWFFAVNPLFIGIAGSAKKEPILFLAVSVFILYIVSSGFKKIYLLIFSSFILILDRFYTLPVLIGTLMFYKRRNSLFIIFIVCIFIIFTELTLGFDYILYRYNEHVTGQISFGSSLLPGHNIFYDLLRTVFGPAFVRDFFYNYQGISFGRSFLTISLYPLIFYKSLFFRAGLDKSIFFLFIYVLLLIPFQSPFKLLMITALAPYFIERISFVRYLSK
jgi:hypothetical protein